MLEFHTRNIDKRLRILKIRVMCDPLIIEEFFPSTYFIPPEKMRKKDLEYYKFAMVLFVTYIVKPGPLC